MTKSAVTRTDRPTICNPPPQYKTKYCFLALIQFIDGGALVAASVPIENQL